ncbi:MAG: kynureninase [Anaerolineae bacterium]|nr:kynureninase [Anaerolineae bacterium]
MPGSPSTSPASFIDELATFRDAFAISDPDLIYLDGNSLGRLPKATLESLAQVVSQEWGEGLIRGWNLNWYAAASRIGDKIAPLLGAASGQVVVTDTTSINLYKLAMAALARLPERKKIVTDELNFPSDLYILQSCINQLGEGYTLQLVRSHDGMTIALDDLAGAVDEDTALVSLSHVAFKSGFMYDAEQVTRRAHQAGALMLWDICHAVGAVPLELDAWGADLSVGCTYKYLNGGPGAPAFLYVRRDLQDELQQPIWGWFAERQPFAFELDFTPAQGMRRFLVSSPPILSTLAMEAALDIVLQAGIERIRRKSIAQTSYLIELFDTRLVQLGFKLGTPRNPTLRGSHVSIRHPEGYRINRALIDEMKVIPDFREPDNIRLGIAPLYTSFDEIHEAVERICQVVTEKRYLKYPLQRQAVT